MRSGRASRIALGTATAVMVCSALGVIATLILGAFVLDDFDAYGEVRVPGTGKVHLPAGRVTVNFHVLTVGGAGGGGLPVPHLMIDIDPPAGAVAPHLVEDVGGSTSVNNDVHRRVWVADVVTEGDYIVTTGGEVNGFISPRLAFGHARASQKDWLIGFGALFALGGLSLLVTRVRRRRRPTPAASAVTSGVVIEQLKTLAALRDSGALTEQEFQDEKRRVLRAD